MSYDKQKKILWSYKWSNTISKHEMNWVCLLFISSVSYTWWENDFVCFVVMAKREDFNFLLRSVAQEFNDFVWLPRASSRHETQKKQRQRYFISFRLYLDHKRKCFFFTLFSIHSIQQHDRSSLSSIHWFSCYSLYQDASTVFAFFDCFRLKMEKVQISSSSSFATHWIFQFALHTWLIAERITAN